MSTPRVTTSTRKARAAFLVKKAVSNAAAGVLLLGALAPGGGGYLSSAKSHKRARRTSADKNSLCGRLTASFCKTLENETPNLARFFGKATGEE